MSSQLTLHSGYDSNACLCHTFLSVLLHYESQSSCELLSNSLMHTNSLKIRNRVERNIFLLSDFSVHTLIEVNMLISVSGLDGVSSAPGYLLTSSATFATTEDNHFFFMKCQINVGNKPCQLNRVALSCILLMFDILHRLQ